MAAALVGVPVVLHFLRGKPRTIIPFPTLRFLGPSALRETRQHRIRRWLTLLMRCALIALLAAAFARPFWAKPPTLNGKAMVIAVDNSYSMTAVDHWAKLKVWAASQLGGLKAGDRAGILLMNPTPRWLVPMTPNLEQVRTAMATLTPGWQTTHYDPALRLAGQTLAQTAAKQRTLVWMGDQQRLGWSGVDFAKPLPAGVKILFPDELLPVAQQAAITRLQVGGTDRKFVVEAAVRLYEPVVAKRTLVLREGTKELARQEIELNVGDEQKVAISIPKEPTQTELALTATLEPVDNLPADDSAYAVFQGEQGSKILLDTVEMAENEADYLAHAVDSMGVVQEQPFRRGDLPAGAWPVRSIAMLRGEEAFGSERAKCLDQFLADGGTVWIWVTGEPQQKSWLERHQVKITPLPLPGAELHHWQDFDVESPLLSDYAQNGLLPLLRIEFEAGWSLQSPGLEGLANWENKTVAAGVLGVGRGRVVLFGFPPSRAASNWPGQSSFVPFLHQMLTALSAQGSLTPVLRVGQAIVLPAEKGTWSKIAGSGALAPQEIAHAAVTPEEPGIYEYRSGNNVWRYAVNLDTQESDLTPWPQKSDWLALQSKDPNPEMKAVADAATQEQGSQQNNWWWMVALALVLLPMELALANRTSL